MRLHCEQGDQDVPAASTEQQVVTWWTSLRRRKVVQWGLVYVAGAWGFLQGLEYVSETFHWPDQVRQISLLALLVAMPIVLVLAWYHGDRGAQRVSGTELAVVTALFLLGGAIFWQYERSSEKPASATIGSDLGKAASAPVDPRPSVAVLPFENRSDIQKDAFFVDGIRDDILTQLSKVSALRVISRTSVERFRKTDLSMQQIAQQLGVKNILEGGVQRAGDRVRINVQLIDAATDAHIWSESYDRELTATNIFCDPKRSRRCHLRRPQDGADDRRTGTSQARTDSRSARLGDIPARQATHGDPQQRGPCRC